MNIYQKKKVRSQQQWIFYFYFIPFIPVEDGRKVAQKWTFKKCRIVVELDRHQDQFKAEGDVTHSKATNERSNAVTFQVTWLQNDKYSQDVENKAEYSDDNASNGGH